MTKKQEPAKKVEFCQNSKGIKTIFTDIIRINANTETVSFDLGIKDEKGEIAEVSDRVIMTLPHFLRFADVCHRSASDILKQIEQIKTKDNASNS